MKRFIILSILLSFIGISHGQQLSQMYDAAIQKMEAEDYTGAIEGFTKLLNQSQYYYDAHLTRGICYEKLKKNDLALADYNDAIVKNPKFHEAYYQRALFYTNVKKDDKTALADLSKAIEIKSNFFPAYVQRGDLYMKDKKFTLASQDYSKAIEIRSSAWEIVYKRAFAYLSDDKNNEALADFSTVIKLKADYTEAYYERAKVYEQRAEYTKAIADFSKAMDLGLKNDDIYIHRANLYYTTKQYKPAIADYTLLVTQYKKRLPEFYSKRGVCYTSTGDSISAQKDFTRAISLDRNNYIIYVYRSENHIKRKRLSFALTDYKKAIELSPKSWDIYYSRGMVYLELEKYQEAIDDFTMAIKYNKEEKFAEGYFMRGACKDALKDLAGACADLKKAASLHHQEALKRVDKYCR